VLTIVGQPLCLAEETRISRELGQHFRCFHNSCQTLDKQNEKSRSPKSERVKRKLKERDFFVSVLSSSATKRDAKAYLSKFQPSSKTKPTKEKPDFLRAPSTTVEARRHKEYEGRLAKSGVNLGGLYTYPTAIEKSPVFTQEPLPESFQIHDVEPLHLAIVVLRYPQQYNDEILDGVALTLAQLARLGLLSVVVIDPRNERKALENNSRRPWSEEIAKQSLRLASAVNKHSSVGARVVDQALGVSKLENDIPCSVPVRGNVVVQLQKLLSTPLKNGIIPIIPPLAVSDTGQLQKVSANDVALALTREFAGLNWPIAAEETSENVPSNADAESIGGTERASLDRIIILDPIGGIPAKNRPDKAHIFINLEQEYETIQSELQTNDLSDQTAPKDPGRRHSIFGMSNPFSRFTEDEIMQIKPKTDVLQQTSPKSEEQSEMQRHLQNLDLIQRALALLPPTSSALLTTPSEAASSAFSALSDEQATGVRTRPKRNPLIHNLLTDKSVISSSLPTARLNASESSSSLPHSTFFKRGMPVTIIPDPLTMPWTAPGPEGSSLDLSSDPRIDFPRLLHLIEDSFGRKLDIKHYISRIRNKVAGIIIAGEYEGGAILTWETPSWNSSRPAVPYLDKFAVLRRAQGSGGVADIVFNAMVRNAFPEGVVWRSRRDNPVNKWYFERSIGTWKVTDKWTMFWTGNEIDFGSGSHVFAGENEERALRWKDYVNVCTHVEPSWADQKPPD